MVAVALALAGPLVGERVKPSTVSELGVPPRVSWLRLSSWAGSACAGAAKLADPPPQDSES
ncbi:hypothetical protein KIMH_04170 [Bombiscardovia apis]|uniref:Secreted protein n=1 Tax=Bombiscardovia apis TaxID=2932182 RepID=A0ABM8BBN6_9BIFI|nr:hypothetical protein KIMH_04170 [Bombiscardovia apis]